MKKFLLLALSAIAQPMTIMSMDNLTLEQDKEIIQIALMANLATTPNKFGIINSLVNHFAGHITTDELPPSLRALGITQKKKVVAECIEGKKSLLSFGLGKYVTNDSCTPKIKIINEDLLKTFLKNEENMRTLGIDIPGNEHFLHDNQQGWQKLALFTAKKALETMPKKEQIIYNLINVLTDQTELDNITNDYMYTLADRGFLKRIKTENSSYSSLSSNKSYRSPLAQFVNQEVLERLLLNKEALSTILSNDNNKSKEEEKLTEE